MCRFSHLTIGEQVKLYAPPSSHCCQCDEIFMYAGQAIYDGHKNVNNVIYDAFSLLEEAICQGCGEKILRHYDRCRDGEDSMEIKWQIKLLQLEEIERTNNERSSENLQEYRHFPRTAFI